ncbi:NAD-dependent epimerase/dehydratase [Ophiocordyceps camponoti-floridani]|uniref:NAD-dependent epimerase/dehydratase n=1 Tax=Ophiocordyceps camponoti-floridani TaxID=2030778 RepID=A0A8H4Q0I2_9HYPO|nr:NAD-dependent epimerase/dehydratase [Ophiocordyceps camponoti-floridani]
MPPAECKVLLVGVSGYIGGTVLDHLIRETTAWSQPLTFDLVVRREEQAEKIRETYQGRVNTTVWKGLGDTEFITQFSSQFDIIINAACGFVPDGAKAFVEGLALRLDKGHPVPWLLHVSGCTNLADLPLTGKAYPDRKWEDENSEEVFRLLERQEIEQGPYGQRTAELGVLTAAEESGVQALSLSLPIVFGRGTGLFNRDGVAIPLAMRYVVGHGHGFELSADARHGWVHVQDLADVFVLLVRTILSRQDRGVGYIPSGKGGIMFPVAGQCTGRELVSGCLDAAFDAGALPREETPQHKEIKQISLQEVIDELGAGSAAVTERSWAGTKVQIGTMAKKLLGWQPSRLEEAWREEFTNEIAAMQRGERDGVSMAGIIGVK